MLTNQNEFKVKMAETVSVEDLIDYDLEGTQVDTSAFWDQVMVMDTMSIAELIKMAESIVDAVASNGDFEEDEYFHHIDQTSIDVLAVVEVAENCTNIDFGNNDPEEIYDFVLDHQELFDALRDIIEDLYYLMDNRIQYYDELNEIYLTKLKYAGIADGVNNFADRVATAIEKIDTEDIAKTLAPALETLAKKIPDFSDADTASKFLGMVRKLKK